MKESNATIAMRNGFDSVIDEYCDSGDCPDKNDCPGNCKVRQLSRWIWGIKKRGKNEGKQSSTK
jgi:hypothetical protein